MIPQDVWSKGGEYTRAASLSIYRNKIYIVGGITFGHISGTNAWFDENHIEKDTREKLSDAPRI